MSSQVPPVKPSDCNCSFPSPLVLRHAQTDHEISCPAHVRIMRLKGQQDRSTSLDPPAEKNSGPAIRYEMRHRIINGLDEFGVYDTLHLRIANFGADKTSAENSVIKLNRGENPSNLVWFSLRLWLDNDPCKSGVNEVGTEESQPNSYKENSKPIRQLQSALHGKRGPDQQRIAEQGLAWVDLILRKNSDYGSSVFKVPVLAPNLSPGDAILVRMSDKIDWLISLQKKGTAEVAESLEDTIRDLGAYCLLYLCRSTESPEAEKMRQGLPKDECCQECGIWIGLPGTEGHTILYMAGTEKHLCEKCNEKLLPYVMDAAGRHHMAF